MPAILNPVHGADRIAWFFLGLQSKYTLLENSVSAYQLGPGRAAAG
ncbi:MAG: hypothetical protein JO210_07020 [Acidobacteriaceae bacterium]|nr:hypothetical protein [Acidobacteriaceae bacterium]